MLYYVSLALAVSTLRDNRFHSASVAGMRAVLVFVPRNFSHSIFRAADIARNTVEPQIIVSGSNASCSTRAQGVYLNKNFHIESYYFIYF